MGGLLYFSRFLRRLGYLEVGCAATSAGQLADQRSSGKGKAIRKREKATQQQMRWAAFSKFTCFFGSSAT
jgi:hypothetical protein